jgi:alpha-galactosidase
MNLLKKETQGLDYSLDGNSFKISSLAGIAAVPPPGLGLFALKTDKGFFREYISSVSAGADDTGLTARFTLPGGIEVTIQWKEYAEGITERSDTVKNNGSGTVRIYAYQARTSFAGTYRSYTQANFWTKENQGHWENLSHGVREIGSHGGRNCLGSTPYMALQNTVSGSILAFHLLADGDWSIRAEVYDESFLTISAGPAQTELAYPLASGEAAVFSRTIFQALPGNTIESGIAPFQRYLLRDPAYQKMKYIPVEFNTWFYDFDNLNENDLLRQLDCAAEIGCEAFTIDAGWYGCMEGRWGEQAGDWREKQDGAFHGKMRAFADKVRSRGLLFGIWIEPERFSKNVPVVKTHPDWFLLNSSGEFLYPDLDNNDTADYLYTMICEIIDRYGAGWVKIDFNHILGQDPRGKAHKSYTGRFLGIMDKVREKYPALILELCASGGFRAECETLKHFDTSFLSDSVNPFDMLRISEAAALRLLTGTTLRWCCLYSGGSLPWYSRNEKQNAILTPKKAIWDDAEKVSADFCLKTCLQGQLSFSGQLADLDDPAREKIKKAVGFYKQHQKLIQQGIREQLTPIAPINDRTGWSAFYIHSEDCSEGIFFAFRLDTTESRMSFHLPSGAAKGSYRLTDYDSGETMNITEKNLRDDGIVLEIPEKNSGIILYLSRRA